MIIIKNPYEIVCERSAQKSRRAPVNVSLLLCCSLSLLFACGHDRGAEFNDPDYQRDYAQASQAFQRRDLATAGKLADVLLRRAPHGASALMLEGKTAYYQKNYERAGEHFAEVLDRYPEHSSAKRWCICGSRRSIMRRGCWKSGGRAGDFGGAESRRSGVKAVD